MELLSPSPVLSRTLSYTMHVSPMTEALTIRLPAEQRRALRVRAAATKKSESQVVRDLAHGRLAIEARPCTVVPHV